MRETRRAESSQPRAETHTTPGTHLPAFGKLEENPGKNAHFYHCLALTHMVHPVSYSPYLDGKAAGEGGRGGKRLHQLLGGVVPEPPVAGETGGVGHDFGLFTRCEVPTIAKRT